ncbi:MAG TPA: MBL fold metallo-hydrolase [Candidatus Tectomicrobia bacterium]|nr:MBL fold metallo-hydrolase [Candidatus Tectomicrobia bacterium]
MVDPQENVAPYLEAAAQKGLRITHVFETHVQADHRSGARALAAATGAAVLLHESADVAFPHVDLRHAEQHDLGNVVVEVLHTPGHTPESVCLLVTDRARSREPWFVLTGDTLFSGSVGRPDLVGDGAERQAADQLHDSLFGTLLALPDHLEIYPAHFGGAACGKGLSGKPISTIGFERRFNPALQLRSRADFVAWVLADLPPQPPAFAEHRRRNSGRT